MKPCRNCQACSGLQSAISITMPTLPQPARFIFATCQVGAEKAVKGEVARRWPDFRFAYSRPGFLTFKLPEQQFLARLQPLLGLRPHLRFFAG